MEVIQAAFKKSYFHSPLLGLLYRKHLQNVLPREDLQILSIYKRSFKCPSNNFKRVSVSINGLCQPSIYRTTLIDIRL